MGNPAQTSLNGDTIRIPYSTPNAGTATLVVQGLTSPFNWTPPSIVKITHYDPDVGKIVTDTATVGGNQGPITLSIRVARKGDASLFS